jgi:hypothetical protein
LSSSMAVLGCPVGYMNVMEDSRDKLDFPVGYINVNRGFRAKLECSVGYINIMEGPVAVLGCPLGYSLLSSSCHNSAESVSVGSGAVLLFNMGARWGTWTSRKETMAELECPVVYINVSEGFRSKLECPWGYINVMEETMAILECPVGYINVTEGFRFKLECPVGYINVIKESVAVLGSPLGYSLLSSSPAITQPSGPESVSVGSRAVLLFKHGCPVGYINVMEGCTSKLECQVGYLNVMEVSRAKPEFLVGYKNVMEESMAVLGCPVGYSLLSLSCHSSAESVSVGSAAVLLFKYGCPVG